ncbi:MAG: N-acetylglucosamine-6-phosphate deacetylase [Dongiaceae bacterium]
MAIEALIGAGIFDGHQLRPQAALLLRDGHVLDIVDHDLIPSDARIEEIDGGILAPGFIDVQVNGGGGVMLNDDRSPNGMAIIAKAHRRFGTTGLLPTLITDTPLVTAETIAAAAEAVKTRPGILGLHLEGPHLSPARHGVHLPELMRPLTDKDAEALIAAKDAIGTLLVTVAVEQALPSQIRKLSDAGIIVSLGHTDADYDNAMAAIDAGASGITHLFNAMSPLTSRKPGVVGAALQAGSVWCGIIADGEHVHQASLSAAIRAKQFPGRLFLVTDAMSTIDTDRATFQINGRTAYRRNGRLEMPDGTIAGSDVDMMSCVRFAHRHLGVSIEEALRMASLYPARFLRLDGDRGHLLAGAIADFVHLDEMLQIRKVWVGGRTH